MTEAQVSVQLPLDLAPEALSALDVMRLRSDILAHLASLRLPSWAGNSDPGSVSKDSIRAMHASQRREILARELAALTTRLPAIIANFADGSEICPQQIEPELISVDSSGPTADLFRFAALLWSVPVSKGYGRRMRFLVRDRNNGKLIGIFGLTDPVFNLRARDEWIGWDSTRRKAALVHLMDAYVVGAVPPYSLLRGGKLVVSAMAASQVGQAFQARYGQLPGTISHQNKSPRLAAVTVTSALGRSSLYNRLHLYSAPDKTGSKRLLVDLKFLGSTSGYGHFHLSQSIFSRLRILVRETGHSYADGYRYGDGPNWRIRLARVGLRTLGLDPELLRHGIVRDVYVMPLASNAREFLSGEARDAVIHGAPIEEIGRLARERWIMPRSETHQEFGRFERSSLLMSLREVLDGG